MEKSIATPFFFSWQNCATQVFYYWQLFTQNSTGLLQIESLAHKKAHFTSKNLNLMLYNSQVKNVWFLRKKMSLENYWSCYREFHHLSTICTRTESLGFEISYQAKNVSNWCNFHSHGWRLLILPTKRLIWTWVRRCHSWCSVCSNSFKVWTVSIGIKSGLLAGHGSVAIDSSRK